MKTLRLLLLIIFFNLSHCPIWAQNVFTNINLTSGNSDNTGRLSAQLGLEVLHSTFGVSFENGASFEHIGQFYVAEDGIWNPNGDQGTDYFGYAPIGLGSNLPYQGKGIMGASSVNGGTGAGRPTFGYIQLNSTGLFPATAGMWINHSLAFNANGPTQPSIITTPNATSPNSTKNAIAFAQMASITGADQLNYIDGFASVINPVGSFTLPVGDATDPISAFHPVTINKAIQGTVTTRYQYTLSHPATALSRGIGSVSAVGSWPISAPANTSITVNLPTLSLSPKEAANLRLVGWDGHQWIDLSNSPTLGACTTGNCPLTGTLVASITDLAIGSTSQALSFQGEPISLTLWPNPAQSQLNIRISNGQTIAEVNVLNLLGRLVLKSYQSISSISISGLPAGSYILEIKTLEGHTLRQSFIKQL